MTDGMSGGLRGSTCPKSGKRMSDLSLDRRSFLGTSLAFGAAASTLNAASWMRVSGSNDRINLGVIGCGPQGIFHIRNFYRRREDDNVWLTRACDVYSRRLERAAKALPGGMTDATMEYRELLDDKDLDAVVVSVPDHWHAKMAIEGLEAGKAVFLETPFTHTIEQALALRDAADASSSVLAVGARRCSDARYRQLHEAILMNRLENVLWSQGAVCMNSRLPIFNRQMDGNVSDRPKEQGYIWWERWLGSDFGLAPKVPFSADRFFRYQKYYDYGGGIPAELLFHVLTPILLAIAGEEGEIPSRVVCGGGQYSFFDEREVPDQVMGVLDFPSEHTITLSGSGATDSSPELMFRSRIATVTFSHDPTKRMHFEEQDAFYPEFRHNNKDLVDATMEQTPKGQWIPVPPKGEASFDIEQIPGRDHNGNFLDAIRGEAKVACNAKLACTSMIGIAMMIEAYRQMKVMRWDHANERLIEEGNGEATQADAPSNPEAGNEADSAQ